MTVTRSLCAGEGGTFTSSLPVLPKLIFTRRADACTATLDAGIAGLPPLALTTTDGHWYPSAPAALALVEEPYGGVAVDGNGDGTLEASLLPSTTNFHPGVRVPRCGCCQTQPSACSFPLMPAQCLASGGSFVPGADCGPAGSCEASCAPAGQAQIRMTIGSGPAAAHGVLPTTTNQADADGDLVPDIGDNCAPPSHPGVVNGLQEDLDGDGVGDACDNCPSLCSLGQEDTDLDGAGDACDCAPFDATVKARPGRIGGLTVQRALPSGTITVAWSSLDPAAGSATQYDAVRGSVGALHGAGYPGGAVCALGHAPDTPYVEPAAACPAGAANGCWYLVRAANSCGTGTYADAGQAQPHPLDTASPCP